MFDETVHKAQVQLGVAIFQRYHYHTVWEGTLVISCILATVNGKKGAFQRELGAVGHVSPSLRVCGIHASFPVIIRYIFLHFRFEG